MLSNQKSITYTGQSLIDGVVAEQYSATINSDNPKDLTISSWQTDGALYKANRTQCRQDQANFEDMVYAEQDTMIAAMESEDGSEEEEESKS